MPSGSYFRWTTTRADSLNAMEAAHRRLGAKGAGLVFMRQQVIQGYVTQISSQFQGFCRDLYSECLDAAANVIMPVSARGCFRAGFQFGKKLEMNNPTPGTLGTDFGRFGVNLWSALEAADPTHKTRNKQLELLNHWRNAIAHQDFNKKELNGATTVSLATAKSWRTVCKELATAIDDVMRAHLLTTLGVAPW